MEFFCPSCGSSNKTNLGPGDAKKKVCHSCQEEFTASDNNRSLPFTNSAPAHSSLHVFYRGDGRPRFSIGSNRERLLLYIIAAIGLAAIIAATIYVLA